MARRFLLLLLASLSAAASAQAPRKKVVLAMSGGGAYGLIYLGALEWMERHRIPVDAIAGTSGGALVGGWYATGLELVSDDEILNPREPSRKEELRLQGVAPMMERIDFEHLFDSQPDYRNLSMPQKRQRRLYPNDFFGGLTDSRTLRRDGLVPGQTVGFFLDYIGRDYPLGFNDLPTPFRAVSVDTMEPQNWRTVALGGPQPEIPMGLSRAIRASIAVPVLFAPVEEGEHRLIDGAVRNNLPTDVAIEAFDPDVLIGLRFDSGYGPDPYHAGRGGKEAREKVLVTFNPGKNRVDQFGRWRDLAWLGYQGMEAQRASLEKYALSPAEYLAYRRAKKAKAFDHVPRRVEGDVEGLDGVRHAVIGRDLDDFAVTKDLGQALDRLVADQGLATAGYDLRPGGVLYVRTTRYEGGPTFLRSGLEVESNSADRPYMGVRARLSDLRKDHFSYWADLTLGTEPAFSGGGDIPLGHRFSLTPTFRFDRPLAFDFQGESRSSSVAMPTTEAGLALTYRPARNLEFSLGGITGKNRASDLQGEPFDAETGGYRALVAKGELDTTDDAVAPRKGTRFALEGRRYDDFGQFSGSFDTYTGPLRDAWGFHAAFGTSFGDDVPFPFEFSPRLDAYRRDELRDDGFFTLGVSETHALSPLPFAFGRLFLVGRVENAWTRARSFPGASVGVLADTRAGAGYLGIGFAEHGAVRLMLGLGRKF